MPIDGGAPRFSLLPGHVQ